MSIRTVLNGGSSHATTDPDTLGVCVLALLAAEVAMILAAGPPVWIKLAAAWWLGCALLLAHADAITHRLPLPLVAIMSTGTLALLAGAGDQPRLGRSAVAGAVLALGLFLLCLPRNGLGLGDAFLAFPIGVALGWFGWTPIVVWMLCASLLMSGWALALLAFRRIAWRSRLPLGPFMLLAVVPAVALSGAAG